MWQFVFNEIIWCIVYNHLNKAALLQVNYRITLPKVNAKFHTHTQIEKKYSPDKTVYGILYQAVIFQV